MIISAAAAILLSALAAQGGQGAAAPDAGTVPPPGLDRRCIVDPASCQIPQPQTLTSAIVARPTSCNRQDHGSCSAPTGGLYTVGEAYAPLGRLQSLMRDPQGYCIATFLDAPIVSTVTYAVCTPP